MFGFGNDYRMLRDRKGNTVSSENSIIVFDTSLDYDSEKFEDTVSGKLKDFDRDLFSFAYEVNVGAGADWPAVAYEVLEKLIPFSAIAAAFFYGDRIEKSALAWKRMATALLSCIRPGGFTDANGAALLALEQVFEKVGCTDVKLLGYTWVDQEVALFNETDKANAAFKIIAELEEIEPRDQKFGPGLHSTPTFLFRFDAGGKIILAKVKGKEVKLTEQ
jgi:hypothetical protein